MCAYQRQKKEREGNRRVVRRYKLPVIREVGTRDVMSNTVNIVNIAVWRI